MSIFINSDDAMDMITFHNRRIAGIKAKAEPEKTVDIIEEYHFKNGDCFKKTFIEIPEAQPAPEAKPHLVPMVWKNLVMEARRLHAKGEHVQAIDLVMDGFPVGYTAGEIA
ncbi:hypothetical protein INE66_004557 [Salmonella enterica subsp. enterica]|nr:hypothetical protein [Salmonella enterica subsp. enterica]